MAWYSKYAGMNKTHECTLDYIKIDSFRFNELLPIMSKNNLDSYTSDFSWIRR